VRAVKWLSELGPTRGPPAQSFLSGFAQSRIVGGEQHVPDALNVGTHVHVGLRFDVTFEDGTPVVDTLKVLESEVSSLVDSFKPEFERT
jgi:hypothetical protein